MLQYDFILSQIDLSMETNVKVSIITPTLNAVQTLEQCIQSVQAQSYPLIDHIIIDGGSSDGTVNLIKRHAHHLSYWHSKPDRNTTEAFNIGFKHISADTNIISFLNADDWLEPMAIHTVVESFTQTQADFIYGSIALHDHNQFIGFVHPAPANKWHKIMYYQLPVPHISTFIKKDVFDKIGPMNDQFNYTADHDYFIRMIKASCQGHLVNKVIANARIYGKAHSFKALREKWLIAKNYNTPIFYRTLIFSKFLLVLMIGKYISTPRGRKLMNKFLKFCGSRHATC